MNNEFASAIAAVSLTAVRSVEIARSVPNVSTMHAALSIPFVRPTLGESAHPSAAKPNAESAERITRLRPKASDKGPCIKLMQAKASK